jgi:hypothetical protein
LKERGSAVEDENLDGLSESELASLLEEKLNAM